MTTGKKLITAEALLAMPDYARGYELIRGELVEMPPTSHERGRVTERFGRRIGNFVEEHDLGHGIAAETGVNVEHDPDTTLAPDYGFISYKRLAESPPPRGYAEVVPDLVLEVAFPNDRQPEIDAKTDVAGCRSSAGLGCLPWNPGGARPSQ